MELAFDQVRSGIGARHTHGRARPAAPDHTVNSSFPHQPRTLVTTDDPALSPHRVPVLTHPLHAIVFGMHTPDLSDQFSITQGRTAHGSGLCRAVTTRGDKPTFCPSQCVTDGLDPELITIHVNVGNHHLVRRPGSAAKNANAVFKISLARRSLSVFSFQPTDLGLFTGSDPGALARIHLRLRYPAPQRLGRDTQLGSNLPDHRKRRRRSIFCQPVSNHANSTIPKRLRIHTWHSPIPSKTTGTIPRTVQSTWRMLGGANRPCGSG